MSTSKKAPPEQPYHHGDLRAALIAAARQTVEKEGFETLSLRGVAEKIGVSNAAPYRHFKDKRALLAALAADGFVALEQAYRKVREIEDPEERLLAGARTFINYAAERPGLFRLMFDSELLADGIAPAADVAEPALIAYTSVERGVAAVLPGRDDKTIKARTIFMWSTLHGLIVLRRNRRLKRFMLGGMSENEAIETLLASAVVAVCRP